MKNKKTIFIFLLIIVLIISLVLFIILKPKEEEKTIYNEDGDIQTELFEFNDFDDKNIKIDGVSIEKVEVYEVNNSLKIVTILKNKTKNDIKGFYLKLEFLDKNNKVLFPTSLNSEEVIPKKGTISIETSVEYNDSNKKISSARIISLEENMGDSMDEMFDDMEEEF